MRLFKRLRLGEILIVSVLLIGGSNLLYGQILNDECRFATSLPTADNYCSTDGAFTNVGATADTKFSNGCVSLQWINGVWFSFVPKEPAVLIRVFGSGEGGTMKSPKILLFEKCNLFVQCSPGKSIGIDELVVDNLIIGHTYFIMVESAVGGEGTFKLCVNDFIPTPVIRDMGSAPDRRVGLGLRPRPIRRRAILRSGI